MTPTEKTSARRSICERLQADPRQRRVGARMPLASRQRARREPERDAQVRARRRAQEERPLEHHRLGRRGSADLARSRVRDDAVLDMRLVAMGHNTIRGAAGGSVLNAELLLTGVAPAPPFLELISAA